MTGRPSPVPGDATHWDARYAQAAHEHATVWSTTPNATVAAVLSHVTPGTAVDLAAGTLITPESVAVVTIPAAGRSLVGLSLTTGQLPAQPLRRDRVGAGRIRPPGGGHRRAGRT